MPERRSGEIGRFYDRISPGYDVLADSSERAIRELGIRALAPSRGQRVVEIGAGTGHGLVSLAKLVGPAGQVHGVDCSPGMIAVARARIQDVGPGHVTLTRGDARALCFRAGSFDAAFMSFTLELFDAAIPQVLAEVRRVLRVGGRVGIVAMARAERPSAMTHLYGWLHRRWPRMIDCSPIDVIAALEAAGFAAETAGAARIWTLPVVAALGVKMPRRGYEITPRRTA